MLITDAKTISHPTWEDVQREISALDARDHSLVTLVPAPPKGAFAGGHHMAIRTDGNGRFIVHVTEDNSTFWNLMASERAGNVRKARLLVEGREYDYPESRFVARELALRAARQYVEDGSRAANMTWIKDQRQRREA